MKKILALLLALVMMLSLTACGGEKIEITTDNWQDYLEIRQENIIEESVNALGDVESRCVFRPAMLCLKEEYADKKVSSKTEIALEYKGTGVAYEYKFDDDGKVVIGDKHDPISSGEKNFSEVIDNKTYCQREELKKQVDAYNCVIGLYSSCDDYRQWVNCLENVEVVRIEGTLVLE